MQRAEIEIEIDTHRRYGQHRSVPLTYQGSPTHSHGSVEPGPASDDKRHPYQPTTAPKGCPPCRTVTKTSARISRVRPSNPYRTVEARRHMSRCAGERLPPCAHFASRAPPRPSAGGIHAGTACLLPSPLRRSSVLVRGPCLDTSPPHTQRTNSTQTQTPVTAVS